MCSTELRLMRRLTTKIGDKKYGALGKEQRASMEQLVRENSVLFRKIGMTEAEREQQKLNLEAVLEIDNSSDYPPSLTGTEDSINPIPPPPDSSRPLHGSVAPPSYGRQKSCFAKQARRESGSNRWQPEFKLAGEGRAEWVTE